MIASLVFVSSTSSDMNTTKLFQHDCDNCVYVFTTHGETDYDWYVCPFEVSGMSVVARFGDEGHHYWSCPSSMVRNLKFTPARHLGSDRTSVSQMNLLANVVLDYYEKEMKGWN